MIDFKILTYDDLDLVKQFIDNPQKRAICANTLANIFVWRKHNNTQWAFVADVFILSYGEDDSSNLLCSLHNFEEDNLRGTIEVLLEYASFNNKQLILGALNEEDIKIIEQLIPNKCEDITNNYHSDYIYNRVDLEALPNPKYYSKRKHVNKFKSLYDYRYTPLCRRDKEECLELCLKIHKTQPINSDCYSSLAEELLVINEAFDNFERLGIKGGTLHVNNELVAFTYGAELTNNMFDSMAEKANREYLGAYTMINNLFAQSLPQKYTYINREDDLGIDGLRRAKMMYHPCKIQKNCRVIISK